MQKGGYERMRLGIIVATVVVLGACAAPQPPQPREPQPSADVAPQPPQPAKPQSSAHVAPQPSRPHKPQPRAYVAPILPRPSEDLNDTGLYGVVLGKPFGGFPECAHHRVRPLSSSRIKAPTERVYKERGISAREPCYMRYGSLTGSATPLGTESIIMDWPPKNRPAVLGPRGMQIELINGVVHRFSIQTLGLIQQEFIHGALNKKFGKPTKFAESNQQNSDGATFSVMKESWERPGGVRLVFLGALGSTEEGWVEATTSAIRERNHERAVEKERQKPKL